MIYRKIAFVLAATDHGPMILSRLDYNTVADSSFSYGVGYSLLEEGNFEIQDVVCIKEILSVFRKLRGDGVVALDIGANIGVHTLEWSRHMTGWGKVISFEAQERIFYALTGNIALNNCMNARALNVAISDVVSTIKIPQLNYTEPASYGSLELLKRENQESIGQEINYDVENMIDIPTKTIDDLEFDRIDLIKIDVEGMEISVLRGAEKSIKKFLPLIFLEHIKSDPNELKEFIKKIDYEIIEFGINYVCFHNKDQIRSYL